MGACSSIRLSSQIASSPLTSDALENLNILRKIDSFSDGFSESDKFKIKRTSTKSLSTSSGNSRSAIFSASSSIYSPNNLISKRIWDGQKLCLTNPEIRSGFASFISGMTWMEKISVQLLDQVVRRRRTQDTMELTFNDYSLYPRSRSTSRDSRDRDEILTSTLKRCTQLKMKDSFDNSPRKREVVDTCFSLEELKYILLVSLWPIFLESSEFQCINSGEPCILYEEECGSLFESSKKEESMKEQDLERTKRLKDIYYQSAKAMTEEEVDEILLSGNWVEQVIPIIENVSLSVSISTASRPGLPLIFVNKAFERTTLYSRSEILGKSCKLLHCNKTEGEQSDKIATALSKGEGIKIAITNARKGGDVFLNFLALRPVINTVSPDSSHKMTHVIAVQYDMTKEDASLREIKMVEDFLALMCNILQG